MDFQLRPPSAQWEAVVLVPGTALGVWVWWKPAHAPQDVIIRIPSETIAGLGGQLSLRQVVMAIGLNPQQTVAVITPWAVIDGAGGTNPLLDQAIPPQSPWIDLTVRMALTAAANSLAVPPPSMATATGSSHAIDADWTAVLQAETSLSSLRKQLSALQGKLQSLNRDLNADENIAADNLDKREWQDARRWLRDGMALASRYIKEADTGVTSMAGNKRRLEQLVTDARAGRLSPQQLASAQNEIEAHRKTVVNIQAQMQNVLQSAARDGEQRAQQILSRIAAKVRNQRAKR